MRHILLFLVFASVCLVGAAVSAAPATSPAGSKVFQGWTGTCNNLGACVAIATSDADGFFYVRIARDAGASAPPQVKIVLSVQEALKGAGPAFALTAKGGGKTDLLGPFPATTDPGDTTEFAATVGAGTASLALIDVIRNADTLDYALLSAKGTLDLKGLSATLRWIDAQQGRAGTPTALVAKGMTPIGQVPEPREPPVIVAAPAGSVQEIDKPVLSKAVLAKAEAQPDCDAETVRAHEDAQAWRLGKDMILVAVPCMNGAYNFSDALYFTNAKGTAPRPALLSQPPGTDDGGLAANMVTNVGFDPATMTLSEFAKGRGIGDCGETRSWVWTGRGFTLLEATRLDACPGAMSDDWPNVYSATRK